MLKNYSLKSRSRQCLASQINYKSAIRNGSAGQRMSNASIPLNRTDLTLSKQKNHGHNTHALPPLAVLESYKKFQRMNGSDIDDDLEIVDFKRGLTDAQKSKIVPVTTIPSETVAAAGTAFKHYDQNADGEPRGLLDVPSSCSVYEHKEFNGLRLLPSLLPTECQAILLDRLFHRELSNPLQKTNIHEDYDMPFPPASGEGGLHRASFFSYPESSKSQIFKPLDSQSIHKPINTSQFLRKKLRWLTIGSQYDWKTREYPTSSPTPFPPDITQLVTRLFQNSFTPESGVVLLYSPKDYMPVHRDVSEECERGLASFSLGCDGLFLISRDKNPQDDKTDEKREQDIVVIRVRSGDVVQMGGETRWAWHAMPKVMAGTCPPWLEDWPVGDETPKEYEKWKGYMKGKRLNISCRQVWG